MIWMVAPSYLADLNTFKRDFVRPIQAIFKPDCSEASMSLGVDAVTRLHALIFSPDSPILVRTCEEIERDLPPKVIIAHLHLSPSLQRDMGRWRDSEREREGGGGRGGRDVSEEHT